MSSPLLALPGAVAGNGIDSPVASHYGSLYGEQVTLEAGDGFVEVWHGELHAEQPRFEIATDAVVRTATAKNYTAGKRLYGYVNGDLLYAYDMAAEGHELQPHTHAQLVRQ